MAIKESSEIEGNVVLDETAAADTLKPGAGTGGGDIGKTELMASVVSAMGGMSKEEINKFQEVLSQYGKNKTPGGTVDKSAANKASIAAKGAMKEDVEELFAGDELSEEFREKASTLFEAAVNARVGLEAARIEEEFEAKLEETAAAIEEQLTTKIDTYLDYVAEQWFEENQIAIESTVKVEAADKFIDGVKALFAEHLVEVPEETVDMVESLEARVAELEGQLNEEINEKIELTKLVEEAEKEAIFDEVAEGLAATQVEKLRTLAEGLEYSDADAYRRKVELVKENYFTEKKPTPSSLVVEETTVGSVEELNEETNVVIEAGMQQYVSAIAKTTKK
jgi:AcrR family transcriptional regulator